MKRHSLWDLIDDELSGRLQASKIWMHIGFAVGTYKFILLPEAKLTYDLLTAYLGIVALGYGGMYYLTGKRNGNMGNNEGSDSQGVGSGAVSEDSGDPDGNLRGMAPAGNGGRKQAERAGCKPRRRAY